MLLHSCPDTVHGFPLRKTQTSSPLSQGSFTARCPGQSITTAKADCRCRAPPAPRLRGNFMTIESKGVPAADIREIRLFSITRQGIFVKWAATSGQGCFMNMQSYFYNLVITSLISFLISRLRKKAQTIPLSLDRTFFRSILYIESIQTGYALKHIPFPQDGIVTKIVHHFCYYICQACFVHCQAQDVVCIFSDE